MSDNRIHAYPIAILQDRYGGVYSGGAWLAIASYDEPQDDFNLGVQMSRFDGVVNITDGDDFTASGFVCPWWVGVGHTPDEALQNLYHKLEAR